MPPTRKRVFQRLDKVEQLRRCAMPSLTIAADVLVVKAIQRHGSTGGAYFPRQTLQASQTRNYETEPDCRVAAATRRSRAKSGD